MRIIFKYVENRVNLVIRLFGSLFILGGFGKFFGKMYCLWVVCDSL